MRLTRASLVLPLIALVLAVGTAWGDLQANVTINSASVAPTTVEAGGLLVCSLNFTVELVQPPNHSVDDVWDSWAMEVDGNQRSSGSIRHVLATPSQTHDIVQDIMLPLTITPGEHTLTFICGVKCSWPFCTEEVLVTTERAFTVVTGPPVLSITAPTDVTAEQSDLAGTPVALGTPTVTSLLDREPIVTNDAPAVFPLGLTVVTWTVADHSGNQDTDTQSVTIVDTTPPSLTAPVDVNVETTSPDGTAVDLGTPTASDICDAGVEVGNDAPAVFPLGETVVTWTATDDAGNTATATQTVTVAGIPPATVTINSATVAPPTVQAGGRITATVNFTVEIVDPSALPNDYVWDLWEMKLDGKWAGSGAFSQVVATAPVKTNEMARPISIRLTATLGQHTVTFRCGVGYGDTTDWDIETSVARTFNVIAGPPALSITAPADVTAEQSSQAGTSVDLGTPTVTDPADPNPVVGNDAPAVFPLGTTTVTWTATDCYGNAATAEQTVTVVDTTPPDLTLTVLAPTVPATNRKSLVLAAQVTGVSDVCDSDPDVVIEVTSNEPTKGRGGERNPDSVVVQNGDAWEVWVRAESSGPSGDRIYTITATVTDGSGNQAEAVGVVTVPDGRGKKK